MNRLRFKSFVLSWLVVILTVAVPSQSPPESAVEDPFSTVHYLLSKTDRASSEEGKLCFASSLAAAGRFDDIAAVVEMVEPRGGANTDFVGLVNNLISEGHTKQASELLSLLISRGENDAYDVKQFIKPLVRLGRDSDAESLISRLADTDKIDSSIILVDALREFGRNEKALAIIEKVRPLAEESKFSEDRAELAGREGAEGRHGDAADGAAERAKVVDDGDRGIGEPRRGRGRGGARGPVPGRGHARGGRPSADRRPGRHRRGAVRALTRPVAADPALSELALGRQHHPGVTEQPGRCHRRATDRQQLPEQEAEVQPAERQPAGGNHPVPGQRRVCGQLAQGAAHPACRATQAGQFFGYPWIQGKTRITEFGYDKEDPARNARNGNAG